MNKLANPKSELDLIQGLIKTAEQWAEEALGAAESDNPEYLAWRKGEVIQQAVLYIGHTEDLSRKAFRLYLFKIFKEELYRLVRVPKKDIMSESVFNDDGEQQFMFLRTFEEWFDHMTGPRPAGGLGLPASTKSALWHGITGLMHVVDQGLIPGHTVDEVASLDEGKFQTLATVVNKTMQPDQEEPEKLNKALQLAKSDISREELVSQLQDEGILNRKNPVFKVKWVRVGDKTVSLMVLDDASYRSAAIGLHKRADWEASMLTDMINELEELNGGEPSGDDLSEMLRRL